MVRRLMEARREGSSRSPRLRDVGVGSGGRENIMYEQSAECLLKLRTSVGYGLEGCCALGLATKDRVKHLSTMGIVGRGGPMSTALRPHTAAATGL